MDNSICIVKVRAVRPSSLLHFYIKFLILYYSISPSFYTIVCYDLGGGGGGVA